MSPCGYKQTRFGVDFGLRVEPQRVSGLDFRHPQAKREELAVLVLVELGPCGHGKIPCLVEDRGRTPDLPEVVHLEEAFPQPSSLADAFQPSP